MTAKKTSQAITALTFIMILTIFAKTVPNEEKPIAAYEYSDLGICTGATNVAYSILSDAKDLNIEVEEVSTTAVSEETFEEASKETEVASAYNVPLQAKGIDADKFTYMSYTTITSKNTAQYAINYKSGAYTDEDGCRRIECTWDNEDYYLVAIGQGYGFEAGDYIRIFFEDGTSVKAVVGDMKAKADTDETLRYQAIDGSVVELIVEDTLIQKPESFTHGNVVSIEELTLG